MECEDSCTPEAIQLSSNKQSVHRRRLQNQNDLIGRNSMPSLESFLCLKRNLISCIST